MTPKEFSIYVHSTNIAVGESISLSVRAESIDTESLRITWGDGSDSIASTTNSHTYEIGGEYALTVVGLTTNYTYISLTITVKSVYESLETLGYRFLEDVLVLPNSPKIPDNDFLNATTLNYLVDKIYENYEYLKEKAYVVETTFPKQFIASVSATLGGYIYWKNAQPTVNTTYAIIGCDFDGDYLYLMRKYLLLDGNYYSTFGVFENQQGITIGSGDNVTDVELASRGFRRKGNEIFIYNQTKIKKYIYSAALNKLIFVREFPFSDFSSESLYDIQDVAIDDNYQLFVLDIKDGAGRIFCYDRALKKRYTITDGLDDNDNLPVALSVSGSTLFVAREDGSVIEIESFQITNTYTFDEIGDEEILKFGYDKLKDYFYILTNTNLYRYIKSGNSFVYVYDYKKSTGVSRTLYDYAINDRNEMIISGDGWIARYDVSSSIKQLSVSHTQPYTLPQLKINRNSYVNSESYNEVLYRLFILNHVLYRSIKQKTIKETVLSTGVSTYSYELFSPETINTEGFYIAINEPLTKLVFARILNKILEIQSKIRDALTVTEETVL